VKHYIVSEEQLEHLSTVEYPQLVLRRRPELPELKRLSYEEIEDIWNKSFPDDWQDHPHTRFLDAIMDKLGVPE
jgi:hypothetical protein